MRATVVGAVVVAADVDPAVTGTARTIAVKTGTRSHPRPPDLTNEDTTVSVVIGPVGRGWRDRHALSENGLVPNHRLRLLVVGSALWAGACTNDGSTISSTDAPASSVAVSEDRSLDVSYADGMIEVSFVRLGHPSRAMHARVVTWSDGAWRYFGTLRAENANTVGTLSTDAEDRVEVLDGVNTAPAPDRYRVGGLPAGRYLICALLIDSDNPAEVCGELVVD